MIIYIYLTGCVIWKMNNYNRVKHSFNIYRRYPHWKKQGAIFIHVPKVAGTSINKAIYGRTLGHYTALEIKNKFPGLYKDSFVFSFVRNPWSRVVSAYNFAKQGRTESMGVHKPEQYKIPEFESFESFVNDWLTLKDVNNLDYIFQPQVRFLTDSNGCIIVDYFERVENLASGILEVERKLNREIKVGRVNATSSTDEYRNYYTNERLIDLVSEVYKSDIRTFGYCF